MSFISTLTGISGLLSESLKIADSFLQPQVIIRNKNDLTEAIPIEVTKVIKYEFETEITENPITDIGSGVDYIARKPSVLNLSCKISNVNLNALTDPVGLAIKYGSSYAPQIAGLIKDVGSITKQFTDYGKSEIDNKLNRLREWQLNGIPVDFVGLPLDEKKFTPIKEEIYYLIQKVSPEKNDTTGDGADVEIIIKMLFVTQEAEFTPATIGGKLKTSVSNIDLPSLGSLL